MAFMAFIFHLFGFKNGPCGFSQVRNYERNFKPEKPKAIIWL